MKARLSTKTFFCGLVLVMLTGMNAFAQKKNKKDKVLEGLKYTVTVTEEVVGKKAPKPADDELYFHDMKLKSDFFDEKYKFEKAAFTYTLDTTDVDNRIINFNCEMENDSKDKLMWGGKIEEESIEGKIIWMKKDKVKKSFSFSGSIKKKK